MQSYAHGLAALKLSSKDSGLTIDNVDETMAELAEVIIIIQQTNNIAITFNFYYYRS